MFISVTTKAAANQRIKPISQDKQLTFLRFSISKHFSFIFTTFSCSCYLLDSQFSIPHFSMWFLFFFSVCLLARLCDREKVSNNQKMLLVFYNYMLLFCSSFFSPLVSSESTLQINSHSSSILSGVRFICSCTTWNYGGRKKNLHFHSNHF